MAIPILRASGVNPSASEELEAACRTRGTELATVMERIDAAEARVADSWPSRAIPSLIDHIERTYHRVFDRDVRAAEAAIDEAIRGAAQPASEPTSTPHATRRAWTFLRERLDELRILVREHMAKEEQVLFPWLSSHGGTAGGPIRAMQLEHADTIRLLLGMGVACHACSGPHAPAIAALLDAIERQLCEHIYLEDCVLFRRALEG